MSLINLQRDWTLEETSDGPRVVIPAPKLWPVSVFFLFWLSGWIAGEVSAIRQLWSAFERGGANELFAGAFLLFWLAGWTVGGLFAWGVFFFTLDGREVLTVRENKFCVKLETVLGLGWTWRFDIAGMAPPRLAMAGESLGINRADPNPLGRLDAGFIAIESGGRKWKLGAGLPEARAKDLLYVLTSRFGLPRAH